MEIIKSYVRATCHSFVRALFAGAVLLIASSVQAQNLFVSDDSGKSMNSQRNGVQSTLLRVE